MTDPNTPPHLTTWDDLDALVSDRYTGMTNAVYLYPPFPFPFFVHGGYATLDDNGDLMDATNLFVSSTLLGVPIWHVWVNETQLTERVWQIIGTNNVCFRTNTVPSSFDPQSWVRVNYGQPPSYLTGTKLNQWYAGRDRSRLHLDFKLIASNDWPTLLAAFAAAATNTPTPATPPPTMPVDSNRLAFAGIETTYSNVTTRLWIYTPTNEQVDVFTRTALSSVTNLWVLRGTLDATAPFDTWDASTTNQPVNFFHTALAGIDSDGDGLPDGREILVFGTDPEIADTDNDGLSDFEELYRYGTDPLNPDRTPPIVTIVTPVAGSWQAVLP
jgi:hypothetical protein